jgi:hypothetical protein
MNVVLLVAFALVALSGPLRAAGRRPGRRRRIRARPSVGMAIAVLCVLAAGLIVCYDLYLIVA